MTTKEIEIKTIAKKFIENNDGIFYSDVIMLPINFDLKSFIKTFGDKIFKILQVREIVVQNTEITNLFTNYYFNKKGLLISQISSNFSVNIFYNKKDLINKIHYHSKNSSFTIFSYLGNYYNETNIHAPLYENIEKNGIKKRYYNSEKQLIREVWIPLDQYGTYTEQWFLNKKLVKNKNVNKTTNLLPNWYRTFIFIISYNLYKLKVWQYFKFIKKIELELKTYKDYI